MKTNDPSRLLSHTPQFSLLTHLSLDPLKLLGKKKKKQRSVWTEDVKNSLVCLGLLGSHSCVRELSICPHD